MSEFVLEPGAVLKMLAKEFGGKYFKRHVDVESKNFVVAKPFPREVGEFILTFADDDGANSFFERARQQSHFRTREVARSYSAKKRGKSVIIYYAESVSSLMECTEKPCDLECLFFFISAQGGGQRQGPRPR